MQTIKSEIIIDGDTVIVNGETYVKQQVAEPQEVAEVHPFLKDVPKVGGMAYWLNSESVGEEQTWAEQSEIDRGTVSLNRDHLVELDNRRLALTALKKWIGENGIPVATEEQMADPTCLKICFRFDRQLGKVEPYEWLWVQSIGDINLLSGTDFYKVRDNCDALIRKAYGWPEVG